MLIGKQLHLSRHRHFMNLSKTLQLALMALFANNLAASHFIPKFAIKKSISKVTLPYAIGMAAYLALAYRDSVPEIYRSFKYTEKNITIDCPASPEVTKFVADRLIKHHLDPKDLRITLRPARKIFTLGVLGLKTLLMGQDIHDEILDLVTKSNLSPREREKLLCYTIKIDHEVAHMKYKDGIYHARARMLTALALQGVVWGAAKIFKFGHHFEPSYIDQTKPFAKLEACAFLTMLGFMQGVAYKIALDKYTLFQETRANQFAYEAAETAETLHAYRKEIREAQDRNIKQAAYMAVSVVDTSNPFIETYINCSYWANFRFRCYAQDLYRTYKQETTKAQQSFKGFEAWLIIQPDFAHRVGKITCPTYPSTQENLKAIRKLLRKF
jgi:hypothetical protein